MVHLLQFRLLPFHFCIAARETGSAAGMVVCHRNPIAQINAIIPPPPTPLTSRNSLLALGLANMNYNMIHSKDITIYRYCLTLARSKLRVQPQSLERALLVA